MMALMTDRLSRLVPLTGLVFSALAVGAFMSSQVPPHAKASGAQVVAFFTAHSTGQQVSDELWFLAFSFLLLFAGVLRASLRRAPETEALSALSLAGAAVLVAGATAYFGFDYVLAVVPSHLDPAAAQALNLLALRLVFPLAAGGFVFGVSTGLGILRSALLPTWLGWVAIVSGLAMLTPGVFVGIVLLILWVAVTSVLVYRRQAPA